jgi:dihydroflavonol-4-reductase
MIEVAKVLRARMGAAAAKVAVRELPNAVVRMAALANPAMKGVLPFLGLNMNATSDKAVRLLGWAPRPAEDAIVATAESLIALGLLAGA